MMYRGYFKILACPDCGGSIKEITDREQVLGFHCGLCELVYPISDDIPILLPKSARSYDLEYALITAIGDRLCDLSTEKLSKSIDNTFDLIESLKDQKSWEWEDEEWWSQHYKNEMGTSKEKDWGLRIWQREWLVEKLISNIDLRGKKILDVGCGEGQNFRGLLASHCDDTSLYIATDISIEALKLNRFRNRHRNAIYVLSSGNQLPIRKNSIDLLCYFGILHHMERKADTIEHDSELVEHNGFVIIHEALERPFLSTILPFIRPDALEASAHEERVDKDNLLSTINGTKELEIIASRESHTLLFGFMLKFLRIGFLNKKWFYRILLYCDLLFLKMFGRLSSALSSGDIMLVLKKS